MLTWHSQITMTFKGRLRCALAPMSSKALTTPSMIYLMSSPSLSVTSQPISILLHHWQYSDWDSFLVCDYILFVKIKLIYFKFLMSILYVCLCLSNYKIYYVANANCSWNDYSIPFVQKVTTAAQQWRNKLIIIMMMIMTLLVWLNWICRWQLRF